MLGSGQGVFYSWSKTGLQEGKPNCVNTYHAFASVMSALSLTRRKPHGQAEGQAPMEAGAQERMNVC